MTKRFHPLLLLVCLPFALHTPAASKEKVRIPTCDGVDLHADYYAGHGRSPCVLLVHDFESNRRKKTWKELAKALHEDGLTVLGVDLRGHGDSLVVDETEFWLPKYANRKLIRGAGPREIAVGDFDARYDPYLINDLATAKAFLERKSDAGECNACNLVVIAAGKSAALASLWINSEWHRHELVPPAFPGMPPQLRATSEGVNFLGAVFLSPTTQLGGRKVNLAAILDLAGRHGKMPLAFLHGDEDEEGERQAAALVKSLEAGRDLTFTGAVAVPGAGKRRGEELLDPEMGKKVQSWIKTLKEEKGREWLERDAEDSAFVWKAPHNFNVWIPARRPGDRQPVFDSYERFLR